LNLCAAKSGGAMTRACEFFVGRGSQPPGCRCRSLFALSLGGALEECGASRRNITCFRRKFFWIVLARASPHRNRPYLLKFFGARLLGDLFLFTHLLVEVSVLFIYFPLSQAAVEGIAARCAAPITRAPSPSKMARHRTRTSPGRTPSSPLASRSGLTCAHAHLLVARLPLSHPMIPPRTWSTWSAVRSGLEFFYPVLVPVRASPVPSVRKKERKQASQGRDGRTARRHHTGILRRGVPSVVRGSLRQNSFIMAPHAGADV